MELVKPDANTLDHFVSFLFGGLEGYAYLAAMEPGDKTTWQQEFFQYPQEQDRLKQVIRGASNQVEVYLAPALYSAANASRENVKVSNVLWTEFDGNAPDWTDGEFSEPSLIVQSSSSSNQHVYWRLSEPITSISRLEDLNRRITFALGADSSAWDATQVLRPPESFNHKRDTPVLLHQTSDIVYDIGVFDSVAPAPEKESVEWELTELPDVNTVLLTHSFAPDIVTLLNAPKSAVDDRSTSLMNVAYGCAERGLSNNEIMVILLMLDDRWEKFKGRKDRMQRLSHIITLARNKHPDSDAPVGDDMFIYAMGFESIINAEITVDWVIEPMLRETGYMLFVGPSGVGKTQMSLQILIHACLGKDFLHYKMGDPKKVVFFSLEMSHGELKVFFELMAKDLTEDEMELLEENFIVVPLGEPLPLNTKEGQDIVTQFVIEHQPDGVFIDSIGSSVGGNLSKDDLVLDFLKFNDHLRSKYKVFTWMIHHTRKSNAERGGGQPTQDDVYGNQYFLNRASSAYGMFKTKSGSLRIKNFKNRLAINENDYFVDRTENLSFAPSNADVDEAIDNHIKKTTKKDEVVTTENGKFGL